MKIKIKGYEYYQISIPVYSEVVDKLEDYFSFFAVEALNEFLNINLLSTMTEDNKLDYYIYKRRGKVYKRIYVSKDIHDKWIQIPGMYRKYIQFLINQKLQEISKTWKQRFIK